MQIFCTLPVKGLAESMKNKAELWPCFASFPFAFITKKDEIFRKIVRFRLCLYMESKYCERNLIMFFFDFELILNHSFSLKNQ